MKGSFQLKMVARCYKRPKISTTYEHHIKPIKKKYSHEIDVFTDFSEYFFNTTVKTIND